MALLYFDFQTNVEQKRKELNAPQLDTLIFKTTDEQILKISCDFESDWGLGKDRVLNGRWKGLEYSIQNKYGDTLEEWTTEDNTEKLCDYLEGAKLVAFYMDEDDLMENGYDESFTPECKNIHVNISVSFPTPEKDHSLYEFNFHEESLMTEFEYFEHLKEETEKSVIVNIQKTNKHINPKTIEVLSSLTEAEAKTVMEDLYRYNLFLYTKSDVEGWLMQNPNIDYLSDESIQTIIEDCAYQYAYEGEYDCNLSYWDNINNLISHELEQYQEEIDQGRENEKDTEYLNER